MHGKPDVRTSDQLRTAIDRGAAGDKIPFPDPAAAPLGTDDEAAGAPSTPSQIAEAARQELAGAPRARRSEAGFPWRYLAIGLVVLAAILSAELTAVFSRGP